jgi:membrane-associated phospholipid phosphatase
MHCAYPLIGLLTAWRVARWNTRIVHVAYTLIMGFAAMYLDHHWLLDAIAGWATALIAVAASDRLLARFPVAVSIPESLASSGGLVPNVVDNRTALRSLANQEQL